MSQGDLRARAVGSSISDAALRRLLDALVSVSQLDASDGRTIYMWGRNIFDDTGDNLHQFGLHGTSRAVLAPSAGTARLGANTRYDVFLKGGQAWLLDRLKEPKKPLDPRHGLRIDFRFMKHTKEVAGV
jgi:hypothetical protein